MVAPYQHFLVNCSNKCSLRIEKKHHIHFTHWKISYLIHHTVWLWRSITRLTISTRCQHYLAWTRILFLSDQHNMSSHFKYRYLSSTLMENFFKPLKQNVKYRDIVTKQINTVKPNVNQVISVNLIAPKLMESSDVWYGR